MLNDTIGDLLPSAFAVALSPIPIVAWFSSWDRPEPDRLERPFALGWLIALTAVSVIVVLVLGASDPDTDDPGIDWLQVAIGILFLAMAANQRKKRPKDGQEPRTPAWMASIDTATPAKAAVLGAAGIRRPSALTGPEAHTATNVARRGSRAARGSGRAGRARTRSGRR